MFTFTDAYLRYGTVKKLINVQDELAEQGLGLKIWDAFRPVEAQLKLWEVCPDPAYVANPNTGHSSHSRGNAVDVTLVYLDGTEVEMPTGFDDFSALADRDYGDVGARSLLGKYRLTERTPSNVNVSVTQGGFFIALPILVSIPSIA